MRNLWIDTGVRLGRRLAVPEVASAAVGDDGVAITESRLTLSAVETAMGNLLEEQRSVIYLVCVEDASYREAQYP